VSEIAKRLSEIQRTLKAPKGQYNNYGKFNFRSCEDILEAAKPLLKEGESVTMEDKLEFIGNRYYVKAIASFSMGSESIKTSAYAREPDEEKGFKPAQITGASSSYARKYALNGLFAIDDTKDADFTNQHEKGNSEPQNQHIGRGGGGSEFGPTEKQIKFIKDLNVKHKVMTDEQINNIKTSRDAKAIIDKILAKDK
jgi:hypothetical protein